MLDNLNEVTFKSVVEIISNMAQKNPKRKGVFELRANTFKEIAESATPIFFDLYTVGKIFSSWSERITYSVSTRGNFLHIYLDNYEACILKAVRKKVRIGFVYDYTITSLELDEVKKEEVLLLRAS